MNLLIAGGTGFLGQHLAPLAASQFKTAYTFFSNDAVKLPNAYQLDLRDGDATLACAAAIQPDVIIHLGGSNRSPDMHHVIVDGTRNVIKAARTTGARLIHMSTDVLFDGSAPPYVEADEPMPIHAYGRAKAEAEALFADCPNHVIVRTSLIYHEDDVYSIEWMQKSLDQGKPIQLFDNQWRNPVQAVDLSMAILELCDHAFTGVIHLAGVQDVTRAHFGRKQLTHFNIPTDNVHDAPDTSGNFPLDVRLDTTLAQTMLNTMLRGVDEVFG